MTTTLALGTIRGRHPDMPCTHYLVDDAALLYNIPQFVAAQITEAVNRFRFDARSYTGIDLYFTGYTVATLAAYLALTRRGIPVNLMVYNRHEDRYSRVSLDYVLQEASA